MAKASDTVQVATEAGAVRVAASYVTGDYATHRALSGRRWCVTHLPTGRAVLTDCVNAKHARVAADALVAVAGLSTALSAVVAAPDAAARRLVSGALFGLRDRTWDIASRPA